MKITILLNGTRSEIEAARLLFDCASEMPAMNAEDAWKWLCEQERFKVWAWSHLESVKAIGYDPVKKQWGPFADKQMSVDTVGDMVAGQVVKLCQPRPIPYSDLITAVQSTFKVSRATGARYIKAAVRLQALKKESGLYACNSNRTPSKII